MILICLYAFFKSNAIQNGLLVVHLNIPSMSGNGEVSLCVFLFHSHRLTTVHNSGSLVPRFGIKSINTVLHAEVIFHLPDLM